MTSFCPNNGFGLGYNGCHNIVDVKGCELYFIFVRVEAEPVNILGCAGANK